MLPLLHDAADVMLLAISDTPDDYFDGRRYAFCFASMPLRCHIHFFSMPLIAMLRDAFLRLPPPDMLMLLDADFSPYATLTSLPLFRFFHAFFSFFRFRCRDDMSGYAATISHANIVNTATDARHTGIAGTQVITLADMHANTRAAR